MLNNYQYVFITNRSSDLCVSFLTDKILDGFDEGLLIGMILINLQHVFDSKNQEILLKNVNLYVF